MRPALLACLLLTLAAPVRAASAELTWEAGKSENCPLPETAVCPVGHKAGKEGVGDDEIEIAASLTRAGAEASIPGAGPVEAKLRPREWAIEHPGGAFANATWLWLNGSLPPAAKETVMLESRTLRTEEGAPPHAYLVTVTTAGPPLSIPVFSFDCGYWFTDYGNWSRACNGSTIRPAPRGVTSGDSTDRMVSTTWRSLTCHPEGEPILSGPACAGSMLAPTLTGADQAWRTATPAVGVRAEIQEVLARINAEEETTRVASPASPWEPARPRAANYPSPLLDDGRVARSAKEWLGRAAAAGETGDPAPRASAPATGTAAAGPPDPVSRPFPMAAATAMGLLALLGAAFLYHRITRDRALDQPTRRRIVEALRQRPGLRAGTLSAALSLNYGTVAAHLRVLERHGIVERIGGPQPRWFLGGATDENARAEALLSTPAGDRILRHVRRVGECTFGELCDAVALAPATVSESISRLASAGLLNKRRDRRRIVVSAASGDGQLSTG